MKEARFVSQNKEKWGKMENVNHLDTDTLASNYVILSDDLSYAKTFYPEEYAAVLRMYIEGYSPAEISERLGIALSTVYKRKDKAVEDLKKGLSSNMLDLFLSFL